MIRLSQYHYHHNLNHLLLRCTWCTSRTAHLLLRTLVLLPVLRRTPAAPVELLLAAVVIPAVVVVVTDDDDHWFRLFF